MISKELLSTVLNVDIGMTNKGDEMISKELLVEILELKRVDKIYIEDNLLYFCELNKGINIYELAHKCKEWAYGNGYDLVSSVGNFNCGKHKGSCMLHDDVNRDYTNCYTGDTEPEAIFKACERVLKDKR